MPSRKINAEGRLPSLTKGLAGIQWSLLCYLLPTYMFHCHESFRIVSHEKNAENCGRLEYVSRRQLIIESVRLGHKESKKMEEVIYNLTEFEKYVDRNVWIRLFITAFSDIFS